MRIALVGPEIEENLALRYLASGLEAAGHRCRIVGFDRAADLPRVARRVLAFHPGLVGFSLVAQRRYEDFQRLARALRARGYCGHVTAGGHFAGLRAQEVLRDTPELDSILHHDGEERIVRLAVWVASAANHHERPCGDPPQELDGITWRGADGRIRHRPPISVPALDRLLPPLRRRPARTLGLNLAPLISSRGCAGACTFCSIHAWHRQVRAARVRFRSPAAVAGEMIALSRERGVRVFVFHDDDFIHPDRDVAARRCRAILEAAEAGIGAPFAFVLKCRPDDVDPALFGYLKSKGLVRAFVGIESGSQLGVRTLNRRVRPGENERALATLRGLGVYSCFNLLLFHPETTLEDLDENLAFLARHRAHPFDVGRTELYARSALEDRMLRDGRAIGDYRGYDYRLADPRAESVFRLFTAALWERHFGSRRLLERVQDLGYRAGLLQRFHPGMASVEFQERVDGLIRQVNDDTVEWLGHLCGFVRREGAVNVGDPAAAALVAAMRSEVEARIREQSARRDALSLELELRAALGRAGIPRLPSMARGTKWAARAAALPCAAAVLSALSCGETTVCDPVPPPTVRFTTDLEPVFDASCATAGCHQSPGPVAGLALESGASYDQLVGVLSTELPALRRVEPGQPETSYIVHKLEGTQSQVGGSGEQMPPGGAALPEFARKVREWITGGAPRN